jgi:hypothetical protein
MTLEAIEQEQAFGLDMVTFCSHTSHTFQSLNIFCFKPLKTKFKEEKDETMVRNNCLEPNNVMLTSWADWPLEPFLPLSSRMKTNGMEPLRDCN